MLAAFLLHRMVNMNITRRNTAGEQAESPEQQDIKASQNDFCRTCLSTENLRLIFCNSKDEEMSHKLKLVTSLEIKRNDTLSQKICNKCLKTINIALMFRIKCINTEKTLLGMVKQNIKKEYSHEKCATDLPTMINIKKVEYTESNYFQNDMILEDIHDIKPNIYECQIQTADENPIQRDVKVSFSNVPLEWVKTVSDRDEKPIHGRNIISTIKNDISESVKLPPKTAAQRQKEYRERLKQQSAEKLETLRLKHAARVLAYRNKIKSERKKNGIPPRPRVRRAKTEHSVTGPPYLCDKCGKEFQKKPTYLAHVRSHTSFFVCEECGKKCKNRFVYTQHKRALHGFARIHKCSYCDHQAPSQESLNGHERRHTGERPYICDYCSVGFYTRRTLIQHIGLHLPDTIQCPFCPKKLKSPILLSNHKAQKHGKQYSFQCPSCPKVFTSNKSAHHHFRSFHQTSKEERPKIGKVLLYSEQKDHQQKV